MIKRLLVSIYIFSFFLFKAQCPQVYNYLGVLSSNPYFINCTGGAYAVNFQSNASWGTYTINWGDLTTNTVGASYTANSILTHTYPAIVDTFVLRLFIPSLNCTLTGVVVQEKPVNASIQIPTLGITTACAPKTLTFTNSSTDVSATTTFTWDFGDGTPDVIRSYTTVGQNITHLYNKGTVNCQTQVTLKAKNYCSFGNPTIANFNPIQIYEVDDAAITPDKLVRCLPDVTFTFSNTTTRNCLAQGNTFQRREWWNFGNYWGLNHDSIINWAPWPPTSPKVISYPPVVGSYSIMLRDSNLCGIDTSIITVNILAHPTASLISPPGPFCQNSAITFTNASPLGYTYLWNFGTGAAFVNLGAGNKANIYTVPGTYTVRMVAQVPGIGGGCSDTAKVVITVLAAPVASFSINNAAGCGSLGGVVFTNLSSGATAWNWNFANGNTSTLQIAPAQSYTFTGTFNPSLVVTGTTGCTNMFSSSIIIRPKPTPAFAQFTTCVGSTVTFTNLSFPTNGANAITGYTWSFGDASPNSNSVSPNHIYTAAGQFTVKLKAQTAFCVDSLSQAILTTVKPSAGYNSTPSIGCPPLAVTFSNTSLNATSFFWNFGAGPTATSSINNPTFTFGNTTQSFVNYTVMLIASTGAGCGDTVRKTITVRPRPVAGFTMNTIAGCSPLLTTFTNTSIGNAVNSWTFGDGGTSASLNPSHTYSNPSLFTQTFTVQLVATNSVGCSDTSRKLITVYPETLPNFTMLPPSGCTPLQVNFPSIPGVATYSWSHGDGSPTFTTLTAHTWTYINTGNSNLTLTVTLNAVTANGCFGSQSKTIAVFAKPTASFNLNPLIGCSPLSVTFSNSSTGQTVNNWTFNNGQTSTAQNPTSTFTNAAGNGTINYNVKLVVNNNSNCFDSIIKVVNLYAQPKAAFKADTPACTQKVMTFTNNSVGGNSFFWTFGDGGISTLSLTSHQFVNTSAFTKTFNVRLMVTDLNNCKDSSIVPINIHPKPEFIISSAPDNGCTPLRVLFRKIVGVTKYEWKYNNIAFGSAGDITNTFENTDNATRNIKVQLIATDAYQCVDTSEKSISVYPKPIAKFSAEPLTAYLPSQSVRFTNLSIGASTFSWTFGDGGKSTDKNPEYTYSKAGEFTVTLIANSQNNCKDTFDLPDRIMVIEESNVVVPNAFTPNLSGSPGTIFDPKDKSNDIFHPNIKGVEKYTLSIYSRWGELLFETKNPEEGWDGYYRGKLCIQDVYVWKINATFIDGGSYNKTGDLLLLR